MTIKNIVSLSVRDIETVTVTCGECGFSVSIPLGMETAPHGSCPNCGTPFPHRAVVALCVAMADAASALDRERFADVDISIEVEKNETGQGSCYGDPGGGGRMIISRPPRWSVD